MFRARLPPNFSTSHKMPRLPCNLHFVTTSRSPANANRKKHATRRVRSTAPAAENEDGHVQSAALATKNAMRVLKTSQKHCACHANCHGVPHACDAKRSYFTPETSKHDPSWKTSYRHGHMAIALTVANGCERLRAVVDGWTTSSEHTSTPMDP